jgi:2'-5' RNA ligase
VPYNLARQFPDKSEEDDSVPHLTLLFAGDLSVADYQKLVEVVQTVARAYEPFTLTMDRYHEFTNNDGQTIPHMTASPNLGRLHAALRATAEVEGIPIDHSYGPEEDDRPYADQFKTHATLAYVDKGEPAYSGPKPTGSWRVIDLEVWGHERQRFPLGSIAADQPADEPVTALERAMEALDLARARPAEEAAMGRFDALLEQESTSLLDRVLDEAGKLKYTKPGKLFGKAVIVKQKKKKPKAPPDEQKALAATQKKILKVANKITGTKLKVQNANVSHKGMDFYFAGGGRFKVRPRSDGSITAKLQGRPKPHYRYRGDGPSLDQALASMKAEKKGKHGQTVTAIDAITKGLSPAITPKVKGKKAKPSVPAGPTSEKVNGVMLFNDMGVDQKVWDRYAMALKDSANLVKKRGFGFMLGNFIMHLRKGTGGAYGNYDMKKKIIEIFVPVLGYKASNESIMLTMVHEMGHHYYYREIPRPKRKEYRWYFDKAKETGGEFATAYGSTKRYEDFAEIFAGYIGKGHQIASKKSYVLTPDIMQRFRTYLAFDNRINLKEDEDKLTGLSGRRPLWTLPEPGVFCETCSCGYDEDDE